MEVNCILEEKIFDKRVTRGWRLVLIKVILKSMWVYMFSFFVALMDSLKNGENCFTFPLGNYQRRRENLTYKKRSWFKAPQGYECCSFMQRVKVA